MSHVYVLVEHENGQISPVTQELFTAARALGSVRAVAVGAPGSCDGLVDGLVRKSQIMTTDWLCQRWKR